MKLALIDLGDHDGAGVDIGGALFAFRTMWHSGTTQLLGGKHTLVSRGRQWIMKPKKSRLNVKS